MAKTYKEKKKVVNGLQWKGDNIDEFKEYAPDANASKTGRSLMIQTKQSMVLLNQNDFLVKDGDKFSGMNEKDFNDKYKAKPE